MRSSGTRAQRRRDERWPPLTSIAPEGRIAGLVTTGSLIASGIVWVGFSVRVFVCSGICPVDSAIGGFLTMILSIVVVVLIAIARRTNDRPVEPDGTAGWLYGLSFIFVVGVAAAVTSIPTVTCPPGSTLSFFGFCAGAHRSRLPIHSNAGLKWMIDVAAVVIGFTVIRSKRWIRVGAPIAGIAWLAGTGDLLARTLGRG